MKKIFALLITFVYLTINSCFAYSELYYLYGVSEQKVSSIVKNNLINLNYRLESENPYYAIYNKNPKDNAVIIIQQNGNDVFYYYYSAEKGNTELNQALLRTFRSFRISYDKYNNTNAINVYDNLAQKVISSDSVNQYNFDEDEYSIPTTNQLYSNNTNNNIYTNNNTNSLNNTNTSSNEIKLPAYPPNITPPQITYSNNQYNINNQSSYNATNAQSTNILKGTVVSVASGTKIKTYLQNPINTSTASKGDQVVAVLTDDLKYNGVVVAPQGSICYGTITKARAATYGSRNGRVVIEFQKLLTPDSKTYEISTEKIDFTVTNDGKLAKTVGNTFTGAAVGALAGLLLGAMGDYSLGTAALVGAGVGAGTALIGSGAERGVDAEIPSFTELELVLTKSFKATSN